MPKKQFPVVYRFASIKPAALSRIQMHARRSGGPIDHIELEFSDRNEVYVGESFAKEIRAEIRAMQRQNLEEEVAACQARGRKKDAEERKARGLLDPWHGNCEGPLREIVLSANKEYFFQDDPNDLEDQLITYGRAKDGSVIVNKLSRRKIAAFKEAGLAFFTKYFSGAVRHLRLDLDEEAPHFHAVLMVTAETVNVSRGRQVQLRPSAHPLIADYELAQDVAGEHFASIGLLRGQKHAEACRKAREEDLPIPDALRHVSPRKYRDERAQALKAQQEAAAARDSDLDARQVNIFLQERTVAAKLDLAERARTSAETEGAKVTKKRTQADKLLKEANAYAMAVVEGTAAVIDRRLDYKAANGDEKEGLCEGPNASEDPEAHKSLWRLIQPAYAQLVEFACGLFQRRDETKREIFRVQSELLRQATVIAESQRMARRSVPTIVRAIIDSAAGAKPVAYDLVSFPDAWSSPDGQSAAEIDQALAAMTNRNLRHRYSGTCDAEALCEDQFELKSKFTYARTILETEADRRGYDLQSGRHDPKSATDPARATLHTDEDNVPLKVIRQERIRTLQRGG